jgi:hypothetical protein
MNRVIRPWPMFVFVPIVAIPLFAWFVKGQAIPAKSASDADYGAVALPLVKKYCRDCHSTKAKKGSLDLERFATIQHVRKDLKPWQQAIEQLETGEMPPRGKPQPTEEERKRLIGWISGFLEAEAKARTGDPGHVPLRRLSNTEYDCTIRDLTGVDLKPTREFPADGAAGEGFTNAAESLSYVTPALFAKYLSAAKEVADHVVLLPDGFRFSPSKTRRDWTDESLAQLRKFYSAYAAPDGRWSVQPYLLATVRHREALSSGKVTLVEVAAKEKINPKYLAILWQTLTNKTPSQLLDAIRAPWRKASEKDVPSLAAEIEAWQTSLWTFVPIGSYRYGNMVRQVANDPKASDTQLLKLAVKLAPGQNDAIIYLNTREQSDGGQVVWHRPRFEQTGKPPLLLRDYPQFGPAFEVDYSAVFADTAKYLAAVAESAHGQRPSIPELGKKHGLDASLLQRWIDVVALPSLKETANETSRTMPATPLTLLAEKTSRNEKHPAINGWRSPGAELPVVLSNASDTIAHIPGRVRPHFVAVHPMPKEFVAVAWKSPIAATVQVIGKVMHAHPACGNGIAWFLEHRRADQAALLADGAVDLGNESMLPMRTLKVEKGDLVLLAIDARDGNHVCDMTEIVFTITEMSPPKRVWNLAADVADSTLQGNPHADSHGNKDVWSFVKGLSKPLSNTKVAQSAFPPASLLGQWRAAAEPSRPLEASKLASQVQSLLTGARPTKEKDPNRIVFDFLVTGDSPLLKGLDLTRFARPRSQAVTYALPRNRFGGGVDGTAIDEASFLAPANSVTEIRLPAALLHNREFVVEARLDGLAGERVVQFQLTTTAPGPSMRWDGKSPVLASLSSGAYKRLLAGFADFRQVFPWHLCFPNVVPTDEVVSLKMFHREDAPLERLFLDEPAKRRIDQLWNEHRFISRQPVAENDYLPQFIGYVTQDQPKQLLDYFESQRPVFKKRADEFEKGYLAAIPKHHQALLDFAARAFRRPLRVKEKADLLDLYQTIRKKGTDHEEAFRGVLARILVSPAFLFRIEKAPAGIEPGPIDDWELASRLSYFLWSSAPDEELHRLAANGKLREPAVLETQTRSMIQDVRLRALAIEFGTQWIHVRGFDELKEKNEKLFPMFDAKLRSDIYEESILFFQDLFQQDRAITQVLDADYTYLNENLAKHYGIPGVAGPHWRRVEGVRQYGRGGILGLASVHAKQSGASRTSPVLRGNWVVETLLGEKLPRPPADVPVLPDVAGGTDKLTTRQMVEKHVSVASCASCHVRIDPFGFAFEKFDPIGRLRDKEAGGLPIDAKARLRDGTELEGIDGLRTYLLTKKKDVIVRLFCRKLLGYALGRATTLSDTALIDDMVTELNKTDGKISAAVLTIVRSPQFRMIRGSDAPNDP